MTVAPQDGVSLITALRRLDGMLASGVAGAEAAYGEAAASDPHRGLYVAQEEVRRLLERDPGTPLLTAEMSEPATGGALNWLAETFGLSDFDLDVVLLALALEVDLRYERLYAYLQDDVTRKRPSVELALNVLCDSTEDKLARRARFGPEAPLVQQRLVELVPDLTELDPPLLAHYLKLDDQVARRLLGDAPLDPRLGAFCELDESEDGENAPPPELERVAAAAGVGGSAKLYLHGPPGAGKRSGARALAGQRGERLLAADLGGALDEAAGFERLLALVLREARLQQALPYLHNLDALRSEERRSADRSLVRALRAAPGLVVLAGLEPWAPARSATAPGLPDLVSVPFAVPGPARRRETWRASLDGHGTVDEGDLDALAGRFRLTGGQIRDAVISARESARVRGEGAPAVSDLFSAARAQSGEALARLTRKVVPSYRWEDITLPEDRLEQLREICDHLRYRPVVYEDWGFEGKLSLGKGLNVLFSGPSGTGKTMAAEIIAGRLGLDLCKIDLSTVVSKYIGETEKNLSRIFSAAEASSAILFFDEADALFGRRSEVRDSHDRYANVEISYLLQRMEEYDGVVMLATNLRKNMDDAFVRRIHFTIDFPLPSEEGRHRIWEAIWPADTPRSAELDLELMAGRFELTGGNIRNIALAAAFLAADDGKVVTMDHLLRATRREYDKMGKVVREGEFGEGAR